MHRRTVQWVAALACAPLLAVAAPVAAHASPAPQRGKAVSSPTELADGLVSPLAMAVARDGTVYVSEQFAGRLTSVSPRGRTRTVAQGPVSGVDVTGRGNLTVTLSAPPEDPSQEAVGAVARVDSRGRLRTIGSTLAHETATNPDAGQTYGFVGAPDGCLAQAGALGLAPYTGIVESNPYAVLVRGGDRVVADAAGNSIVRVRPDGSVRTVAVLPPVPTAFTEELRQSLLAQLPPEEQPPPDALLACVGSTYLAEPVPTDVELGPDGRYYVSSLPGFPEAPGEGAVYRVDPRSGAVVRLFGGLSGAVDLAVGRDGAVYVAELFGGALTRVSRSGARTSVALDSPGAVEVDAKGRVLVTTGVFAPDGGSLLRYDRWPVGAR